MTGATYFLDNKTECYPRYFNGPAVSLHIRFDDAELYSLWIADSETGLADIYITDTPTGSVICGKVILGAQQAHLRIVSHGEDFFRSICGSLYNPSKLITLFEVDPEFRLQILRALNILFLSSPSHKRICAMYESM